MNRPEQGPKKLKHFHHPDSRIKYKTDVIVRPKLKELFAQLPIYNTTPADRSSGKPSNTIEEKPPHPNFFYCKPPEAAAKRSRTDRTSFARSQFDYINNHLCIKSCIGDREVLRFQMKKVSIRNYTPKILNQEINMGMWI